VAGGAFSVASSAFTLPVRTAKAAVGFVPSASAAAGTVTRAGTARIRRRVWSANGRACIEVRGLTGRGLHHRRLAVAVTSTLRRMKGVHWAEVNAVTAQVLVSFDSEQLDLDDLVEAVEVVEAAHGMDTEAFSWSRVQHPFDEAPVRAAVTALAVDMVAMAVAVSGRLTWVPPLPRGVRVPIALVDAQPRLRGALAGRFGPVRTDLFLAVFNAVAQGLTQEPAPLAVDVTYRLLSLGELRARRAVWARREPELHAEGRALPSETHEPVRRPVPLPGGPIEKTADRASVASLVGAGGVLAWTHDPAKAAYAILVMLSKAAYLGREGFAASLGRDLARRGVVPLDGGALRRLDRVDTVVIDSSVLCGSRPQILSAVATSRGMTDAEVWRSAAGVVRGRKLTELRGEGPWAQGEWRLKRSLDAAPGQVEGPTALTLDLFDASGDRKGRVRVGCELGPLADALLSAARAGVGKVALTEHASATEVQAWADEVLPSTVPLAEQIRARQAAGHGVALIAVGDDQALDAADVAVGVLRETNPVSWSADLLTGPGLAEVCRLLYALPVARKVSEGSARLALGGSALGALVAAVGTRRPGALGLAPVHSAALLALFVGARGAHRVARQPDPEPALRAAWHTVTVEDALVRLIAIRRRLAQRRVRRHGIRAAVHSGRVLLAPVAHIPGGAPVVVTLVITPARNSVQLLKAIEEELHDPLTPVLALGAAASAIVGSAVDAWLVSSVMMGNAAISSLQRLRAERAMSKLLIGQELSARRVLWTPPEGEMDGEVFTGITTAPVETVPGHDLSIGDIITVQPSDVVPADARLLIAEDLEVDESSLTGESLPVAKTTDPTPGALLGDRTCMIYEGTAILAGTAYAIVVAVGAATQAGRAAAAASRASPPAGVQVHLGELTRIALPATGLGGAAISALGLLRGVTLRDAVASGIAIAVAAVPEGLPLVATVSQLAAARRLSRHGVLVRSSRSLEALGRIDTICFDKTGTLTEGRLAVTRLAGPSGDVDFGGALGRRLLQVAAHASPQPDETGTRAMAHATDRAVVEAADAHGAFDEQWRLIDELPFETSRGYAASLGEERRRLHLAVKGAPEVVLAHCSSVLEEDLPVTGGASASTTATTVSTSPTDVFAAKAMTRAHRRAAQTLLRRLAEEGLRVLAVAERYPPVELDLTDLQVADLIGDLTLLGFVAIADVPRPSAAAAIERLNEIGIRVTMITGDHPITAVAIARMLGIPDSGRVLTGAELEVLPEEDRVARIATSMVFARVSPEQKVGIVQALQRAGHVVAMTGDGSNDAPAIRLADVGIGVSGRGSSVARNAADIVLADPDTTRIVDAALEGRALWGSVRDAVSILVGGNAGEVAFTLLATAIVGRAPLGTRQFLLVNLLTDMLPALAVALAPTELPTAEEENTNALTAGPVSSFLGPDLARTLAVRGSATALGATIAWLLGRMTGRRRRASTMALAALVGTQLGQTLLTRSHSPLVIATVAVSAVTLAAIVETPGVSHFFDCTPLGPIAWAMVIGSATAATVIATLSPPFPPRSWPRRSTGPNPPRGPASTTRKGHPPPTTSYKYR
jgi:cation-transporting ATPase I